MKEEVKEKSGRKNTAKCSVENFEIGKDFHMSVISNEEKDVFQLKHNIPRGNIHFYFCTQGPLKFSFGPHYSLDLDATGVMLLYNPDKDLPHLLEMTPGAKLVILNVSVERLHQLFMNDEEGLFFLNSENVNNKYYTKGEMSTSLLLGTNQLFNTKLSPLSRALFFKAKGYELLSLYFNREESEDGVKNCPFLEDQSNVDKIRLSKKIMIERMSNPPAIKELAREIGLNEYQLKVGFKNIYGVTVFGFLNDYKMDHSRKMLDSGEYKVNEVAYTLGYTNPSHYITAFKKKYGITPKKYLMSLSN